MTTESHLALPIVSAAATTAVGDILVVGLPIISAFRVLSLGV